MMYGEGRNYGIMELRNQGIKGIKESRNYGVME